MNSLSLSGKSMRVIIIALFLGLVAQARASGTVNRPNIIVIMTDDQEAASLDYMPNVQSWLVLEGVTFSNFFSSFPLCCPARATFLTGQFAHNHGVLDNKPPRGGFGKLDHSNTLPVWLQGTNYYTAMIGRYLNGYGIEDPDTTNGIPACKEIPPGWDEWYGNIFDLDNWVSQSGGLYNSYILNEQGQLIGYGQPQALAAGCSLDQTLPGVYMTDLFSQKAEDFINSRAGSSEPFFLYLNYFAPHADTLSGLAGAVPAPRHAGLFANEPFPTAPAYNEADVSDKPQFIRNLPLLTTQETDTLASGFRNRLEALQAVDEGVDQIMQALQNSGQLNNTVVIFLSDHGFLQGEHRWQGKFVVYEESVKIPAVVLGPGFSTNATLDEMAGIVDLAPTILELAQGSAGLTQDGASLVSLLQGQSVPWREAFLLQSAAGPKYQGLRHSRYEYTEYNAGDRELYDLQIDPFQMQSMHNGSQYQWFINNTLKPLRNTLKTCAGSSCWIPTFPQPDIQVSPLSLDFGAVVVNDTSDLTVTVTNVDSTVLNISELNITNTVFSLVNPLPLPFPIAANGGSRVLTVRFLPTAVSMESGNLEVVSDDPDEPSVNVSLDGQGVNQLPIDITVTLSVPVPVIVPPGGTIFDMTVTVDNNSGSTLNAQVWNTVTLVSRGGEEVGPVAGLPVMPISVPNGGQFSNTFSNFEFPGGLPIGSYIFNWKVGTFPNVELDRDSFAFSKATGPTLGKAADDWGLSPVEDVAVPAKFSLAQNYPNPFNPETEIRFQLPETSQVLLRIYNTLGQEIRTLADGEYAAGFHSIRWDTKDNTGNAVSSGIYLYELKAGGFSQIKKMSLIR